MSKDLSRNERNKEASAYLRGTLAEGVADPITGAIAEDDAQLVKFHGMYLQDDRDLRAERTRKKMEKAFAFMIRVRLTGGVCTPAQWLAMDHIGRTYANGTLRLTTRQTFQFHGVIKSNLKATIRTIDSVLLNTIAACGDVNRNVLSTSNPHQSRAHAAAYELARRISDHLLPRTPAYREVWLDGERILGGEIEGWNVTVGGSMGMTHGEPDTYPRTADVLGFCAPEDAVAVAQAVVPVQRDWGDRANRKHARLKYTIDDRGLDSFRAEVERRTGKPLGAPRPFGCTSTGDR